jgi:hypothetical protein
MKTLLTKILLQYKVGTNLLYLQGLMFLKERATREKIDLLILETPQVDEVGKDRTEKIPQSFNMKL